MESARQSYLGIREFTGGGGEYRRVCFYVTHSTFAEHRVDTYNDIYNDTYVDAYRKCAGVTYVTLRIPLADFAIRRREVRPILRRSSGGSDAIDSRERDFSGRPREFHLRDPFSRRYSRPR